jgi:hypothetical protein
MIPSNNRGGAAPLKARLRRASVLAALALGAAVGAGAQDLRLFPASVPGPRYFRSFDADGEAAIRLVDLEHSYPWGGGGPDLTIEAAIAAAEDPQLSTPAPTAPPPKLFTTTTTIWTIAALVGGFGQGIGAPIHYGTQSWHFTDEKWFQYDTYAGGADKASHFTVSSGVSRLLYDIYRDDGKTVDQSFYLALATTLAAGTMVEIGDAITVYGFSFEDLTADILGATSGLLIHRYHLQDLIGLRLGPAGTTIPEDVGPSEESIGASYSNEIYVVDLKLGGLIRRLNGNPGFSRFLLTSFAFYTKGFGYDPPLPGRYQSVGVELGINFPEILKVLCVPDTTWWGKGLYAFFNFFRIPYTQVGTYYNFKTHKWYGPSAPYHYYH